ncbi:Uncharacterised protein [Mycobacteroides abscessus]|nr:Uncharacterised protein [Mycobacteroides abscessus]CQA09712.1 Uncharacterised protein [Mycobacteroides abscessus]
MPLSSNAVVRPFARGPVMDIAVVSATARNPALATAETTRTINSNGKLAAVAPTMCAAIKTDKNNTSARRRGQRPLIRAISGAPTMMPTANADVSAPAAASETPKSSPTSVMSPANMNSEQPWANMAKVSA